MKDKPPLPRLETPQTAHIRASYPTIEYLENGYVADWLKERCDQLLELAREERSGINANKLICGVVLTTGFFLHALSPLAPIGVVFGLVGYIHGCFIDASRTGLFSPLPFVRGNVLDLAGTLGNAELRETSSNWADEFEQLQHYLSPRECKEYEFLNSHFALLTDYLAQVEPLKRFHAYRWILDSFIQFKAVPTPEQVNAHMTLVQPDLRINNNLLNALDEHRAQIEASRLEDNKPKFIEPQPIKYITDDQLYSGKSEISLPASQTDSTTPSPQALVNMPLPQRANTIINSLKASGFKIDEVIGSQIIAITGNQRGGKGTLAGLLTILSAADNSALKIEYFTAGIDIYPFACNLHSALAHDGRKADEADKLVARELLQFLKKLENSDPYSNKNLLLVIDEAMRLLSLLEESERSEALQFLLSRFEKTGVTLILVLHASNLTSIAGKETGGLAATFKAGINFIGCQTQSVSIGALRKINVASGAYFKANPNNFGEPIRGGELGSLPEWLKIKLHPGNNQPDPVRSLLTFFPELQQDHKALSIPEHEKLGQIDDISRLEFALTIDSKELTDTPQAEFDIGVKKDLSDLAKRLLSFFDNAKNKEPKLLADLKKKDELRLLGDIRLILALGELVDAGQLIFDGKESWSKHDW
ncbi:hypothetical protein [Nostoc sp. FACHB-133]|uniref:hypothetical protein n=1 Tax=Nostoc sp. FACHB-133 TaxID=2692835 RepID=UPI00168228CA|nr:hypothetical protein [Nostoc sp. FACHB-133]MBD2526808.1 hypothetical protein [Nostoc sp. FACHB-133]